MRRALAAQLAAVLAAAALAGCAAPQSDALLARARAGERVPQAHSLAGVPFFPQVDHACGPASLASLLAASGAGVEPQVLVPELLVPGRSGTLAPEMLAAARRHGRLAVQIPGTLDAILSEVDAGRPVAVLLNLGLGWLPLWHYAVVTGYDLRAGELHLHSGSREDEAFAIEVFERTWARAGHWAMVATLPGDLPASPPYDSLLLAAAALERTDPAAARLSWRALAEREPARFEPWMGIGNSSAALGEPGRAREAFEQAVHLAPDRADAWNNLASVLAQQGELARAREAIARALLLPGGHRDIIERTAREIAAPVP